MSHQTTIYLKDYTPPPFLVDEVSLHFDIRDDHTRVQARLELRRNPAVAAEAPLHLDGEALELLELRLDGQVCSEDDYALDAHGLTLVGLPARCVLETTVRIQPDANTQLSGLYRSGSGYFTQCEAEGFRRITYFPDRPDVMARYTVSVEADRARYPVLLSNGNLDAAGDAGGGRHWARWRDPFPKPSYLFALVAAQLECLTDYFTTASGRRVALEIHVQPGKLAQARHAMQALKQAMAWDERRFGLELDLDGYRIVAVDDFNMGAMENKGLNIFNTRYVLASPETATDADYQGIDRVVAHEYFHNWTGNRVTCRDWFQLSLKEGLTVFRDQEFGADVHSAALTRIKEVRALRAAQFPEDAGPMAHPVRPVAYQAIDNFYTATVYRKGAEVIRMMHTLLGEAAFQAGMRLYFERHDGQAVTCEDFLAALRDATPEGAAALAGFEAWYTQAGTPRVTARGAYDPTARRYTLTLTQCNPPTAYEQRLAREGQPQPRPPLPIPVAVGLLGPDGSDLCDTRVLRLDQAEQTFVFEDIPAAPVPSLLRGFSAPVHLDYPYTQADLLHLLACDSDAFNRWEAGQRLAESILHVGIAAGGVDGGWIPAAYADALARLLEAAATGGVDPALVAEILELPSEMVLAEGLDQPDPEVIYRARETLRRHLAASLRDVLQLTRRALAPTGPYRPEPAHVGRRALANACLDLLVTLDEPAVLDLALNQYERADNMTDRLAALTALANRPGPLGDAALERFYDAWREESLVVDKWLAIQAQRRPDGTVGRVRSLLAHPAFDLRVPNRVYALVRNFAAANPRHFHTSDGEGYRLVAEVIARLDPVNPQVAARIARAFDRWRHYDAGRQRHARAALEGLAGRADLSVNTREVVEKALA
jgi:aminopeptidase N